MASTRTEADIVLVEDDADDIAAARRLAAKSPVPVRLVVVETGDDAVALLRGGGAAGPHLIMLDIGLPGIDGIEVLRQIKTEPSLQDVPVIVVTGSADEAHVRAGQALGAHSHIAKPMSLRDFVWIVTSIRNYWQRVAKGLGPEGEGQVPSCSNH